MSMETGWYAFTHPNRATHYPLYTSLCTEELNAIRKQKFSLSAVLSTEGRVLGHAGMNLNLKDLKGMGQVITAKPL